MTTFEILYLIETAALVAVTIVLAYFGNQQLQAIRSQGRQTERIIEHMRLEQRAWLGAGQPKLAPLVVRERVTCVASFHNTGNTPAMIVNSLVAPLIIPKVDNLNIDSDMQVMESLPIQSVISPNGVLNVTDDESVVLTQEQFDNIASGKEQLWVHIRVHYRDAIENKLRRTRLYFLWNPKAGQLYAHDKGNEMT